MNDASYQFEDQYYINPTTSRDEQLSFIDNLRNAQTAANDEISQQTYNLGTRVPANLGGLTTGSSPDSYFQKRFQTSQVDSQVAALKSAAQQTALNQALQNEAAAYQARYNDAYRNYQNRAAKASTSNSGSGSGSNTGTSLLGVDTNAGTSDDNAVSEEVTSVGELGYDGNNVYYQGEGDTKTYLSTPDAAQSLLDGVRDTVTTSMGKWPDMTAMTNGSTYTGKSGTVYMYIKNDQYPSGVIYRISG